MLLCFLHLLESSFLHGTLFRRSKFANFFIWFNAKPFVITYAPKVLFYSIVLEKSKKKIFHFPVVKMAANSAKIDRVGGLDKSFQQVLIVQNCWNFYNIVVFISLLVNGYTRKIFTRDKLYRQEVDFLIFETFKKLELLLKERISRGSKFLGDNCFQICHLGR